MELDAVSCLKFLLQAEAAVKKELGLHLENVTHVNCEHIVPANAWFFKCRA